MTALGKNQEKFVPLLLGLLTFAGGAVTNHIFFRVELERRLTSLETKVGFLVEVNGGRTAYMSSFDPSSKPSALNHDATTIASSIFSRE